MNDIPPVIANYVCEHCGAHSQRPDGKCWLCYEPKSVPNPYASHADSISQNPIKGYAPSHWDHLFTGILIVCVVLTVLIAIGLAVQDRGLLIPFAICVGPAYLVTIARGLMNRGTNGEMRPGTLLRTFAVSIVMTAMVFVVLTAASIVLLLVICLQSLGQVSR